MAQPIKIDKKKTHGYAIVASPDWLYAVQINTTCLSLSGDSLKEFYKDIDAVRAMQDSNSIAEVS